mmetsp:Transcript_170483/g.541570  ORF Transcript_170483/g.541570 Transcript_170483/m.541570 type:complete len:383 (+) Transcript_170483:118-1266(+)
MLRLGRRGCSQEERRGCLAGPPVAARAERHGENGSALGRSLWPLRGLGRPPHEAHEPQGGVARCRRPGFGGWARGCLGRPLRASAPGPRVVPREAVRLIRAYLRVREVAAFASISRGCRHALWLQPEASALWRMLLERRFGDDCAEVVRRARPSAEGPVLYRAARALRQLWLGCVEVVRGGIVEQVDGCEVVACPVARHLAMMVNVGAQGAIRQAVGTELERDLEQLPVPIEELSIHLVSGGALCARVALAATEPPLALVAAMRRPHAEVERLVEGLVDYVTALHRNLLNAVREAGFRSLAMPTLCTGGIGLPIALVAIAVIRACHEDFLRHPSDFIRVRVACFDVSHALALEQMRDEVYIDFYQGPVVYQSLMQALSADRA